VTLLEGGGGGGGGGDVELRWQWSDVLNCTGNIGGDFIFTGIHVSSRVESVNIHDLLVHFRNGSQNPIISPSQSVAVAYFTNE
jgi:hypothetical protein